MAVKKYKICTIAPEGGMSGAVPRRSGDEVAAAERVDNVRVRRLGARTHRPVMRAAVERSKLWDVGRTIRVLYLDGDPAVQAKVTAI